MGNKNSCKKEYWERFIVISFFILIYVFLVFVFVSALMEEDNINNENNYNNLLLENINYCKSIGGKVFDEDKCLFNDKFFYIGPYILATGKNSLYDLKKEKFLFDNQN